MDILLIRPASDILNVIAPMGIGYLLTALVRNKIDCGYIDAHKDKLSVNAIIAVIISKRPKIVGFSLYSCEYAWVKEAVVAIKREIPEVMIVLGGHHVSGIPDFTMQDLPQADFIIVSEGEAALPLLVKKITAGDRDLSEIPNLIWRNKGGYVKNHILTTKNIDDFGIPAWNILMPDKYPNTPHGLLTKRSPVASILTSRGCVYQCTFCAIFVVGGRQIRVRNIENVVDEVELLNKKYGIREIHIEDENFTFYRERVESFCNSIKKRKLDLTFGCPNGVRLDKIDDGILDLMKQVGFYYIGCGVESGSDRVLKDMKKDLDTKRIREGISMLKKHGFFTQGNFIIGYPTETKEDILKTIEFSLSLKLDRAFFHRYLPLPGTADFDARVKNHTLKPQEINWKFYSWENEGNIPISPEGISPGELKALINKASAKFYFRPKIILSALSQIRDFKQLGYLLVRFWRIIITRS